MSFANISTTEKFKPIIDQNQKVICQLPPAKYDAFVKILDLIDVSSVINIKQAVINQMINNNVAILQANISDLIGEIDLQILNPKKYIKILKSIKGNNDVYIIDDEENKRFIITNGEIRVFLPKQIEDLILEDNDIDLSEVKVLGSALNIDKDTRNIIISLIDTEYVELLIYNGQIKGVSIPDKAVYTFSGYIGEKIDDVSADLKLKSFAFLTIPGLDSQLILGEKDNKYWVCTIINTGTTTIKTLENVIAISDDNLII